MPCHISQNRQCLLFIVGIVYLVLLIVGPIQSQSINTTCVSKVTCGECIQSPDCVWCSQPKFENFAGVALDRCNTPAAHQALPDGVRCGTNFLINPENEFYLIRDEEITKGSYHQRTVQIRPQNVTIRLRVGQSYDLHVQYAQAKDYPVDLYYLMDLSKSMEDDKETLSSLGTQLAETMRTLTTNFRLGFGSFVDKVVMPYVSTVEKKLSEPCDNCVPPYGFKSHMQLMEEDDMFAPCPGCEAVYGYQNVMSLDVNTSRFAEKVREARVSGNLDAPEGGFDAIMQAIVCEDIIGWRKNNARRIIVFSTDASFHYAGDGKLGGIVTPNDGNCHMDPFRMEYTHSTILDYPSVAQINSKVKEKSINMIFAVTAEQVGIYNRLSNQIQGSTCGELSANSSNVVQLVKDEYQKITSEVTIKDTSSGVVRVSYFSKCLDGEMKETNKCSGLKVGQTVTFVTKIEITECPKNEADWKQSFDIYAVGLEERLTVNLEMLCRCDCEVRGNPGYVVRDTEICGGFGDSKCGACVCDLNRYGRKCECDYTKHTSGLDDEIGCKFDNSTDIICQNRGQCVCGICECHKRTDNPSEEIFGKHCECDNFSCERENELLCSGPTHGSCKCGGLCLCEPGWTGSACQCSTAKDQCFEPGKKEECGGKGTCKCNRCECISTETERYSGRFCEKCPTCPDRCLELMHCVQCRVHETGEYANPNKCDQECRKFNPEIELVDVATSDENNDEKYCYHTDETDNCRFYYVYSYDRSGKLNIKAQRTKDCPPEPPIGWIIFGVVGAIVLIGLLFLCLWKLLTHIHDRAEYARFEKERMNAKWDAGENPIYKQATSTYNNPMYTRR